MVKAYSASNIAAFIIDFWKRLFGFVYFIDDYYSLKISPQNEKENILIVKPEDLKSLVTKEMTPVCNFLDIMRDNFIFKEFLNNLKFKESQKLEVVYSATYDYLKGSK